MLIYTKSTNQAIELVNTTKEEHNRKAPVVYMVKRMLWSFPRDRSGFESAFVELFSPPFSNLTSDWKGIYFQ